MKLIHCQKPKGKLEFTGADPIKKTSPKCTITSYYGLDEEWYEKFEYADRVEWFKLVD